MRAQRLTVLLLGGSLLALPAAAQESAFVAPGKFVLYDCPQLAKAEARLIERDKELQTLIARAKQGPAGGLISTLVYDPDYYSNLGDLHEVQRERRDKNCTAQSKPGLMPPPPRQQPRR